MNVPLSADITTRGAEVVGAGEEQGGDRALGLAAAPRWATSSVIPTLRREPVPAMAPPTRRNSNPKGCSGCVREFLATETQPRNQAIAHVKKSLAYSHLQNHTAAMEEYREALKLAPRDVLILVNEGLELAQSEDLDAGIAQIQSAVDGNQDSDSLPFALLQLGSLLEKKGDWTGAIERYSMAAQLRSTYVEAHLKLAHALVHERKTAQALDEYNKVARLSGSDLERGYSQMFASQWMANELRNLGNYDGAASAYEAAIHIKADDSAAHCQLALIRARQGHLSQAVRE